MQFSYQLDSLLFGFLLGEGFIFTWILEPVIKEVRVAEDLWEEEVEQGPEFMEIILKRSASEQQFAFSS